MCRFIVSGNAIFNNVIMIQFMYSLFAMATLVFAATSVGAGVRFVIRPILCLQNCSQVVEFTRVALYIANAVCLFVELFLFGLTGSLVLRQADRLNECVYGLRWYAYGRLERQLVALMMVRNQRPVGFSAFNYFWCNLETFQVVSEREREVAD